MTALKQTNNKQGPRLSKRKKTKDSPPITFNHTSSLRVASFKNNSNNSNN